MKYIYILIFTTTLSFNLLSQVENLSITKLSLAPGEVINSDETATIEIKVDNLEFGEYDNANHETDIQLGIPTPLESPPISYTILNGANYLQLNPTCSVGDCIWRIKPDAIIASGDYIEIRYEFDMKDDQDYLDYLVVAQLSHVAADANDAPDDDEAELPLSTIAVSMPVTLLSFTAKSQGLDGELSWVTASETDNDRFEIERSMDGKRFAKIGEVKGNGTTTSKQSYNYTDKGIGSQVNGRVYYRLNQVDYDGSSEESEVRYISFGKGGMSVYPNPTTGNLRIEVPVSTSVVKVYNSIGELVKQANHNSDDAFELSELVDGIYNIRVEDEDGKEIGTEKIVKIK